MHVYFALHCTYLPIGNCPLVNVILTVQSVTGQGGWILKFVWMKTFLPSLGYFGEYFNQFNCVWCQRHNQWTLPKIIRL